MFKKNFYNQKIVHKNKKYKGNKKSNFYVINKKPIFKNNRYYNNFYKKRNRNKKKHFLIPRFKKYIFKNINKIKKFILFRRRTINARGWKKRFGNYKDRKKYRRHFYYIRKFSTTILYFLFPKTVIGDKLRALNYKKKKKDKLFLRFIIKKYFRILKISNYFFLHYILNFKYKEAFNKYFYRKYIKNIFYKSKKFLKTRLFFSLKNFYKFYILRLFKNIYFKYFFFILIDKLKIFKINDRNIFLKYEFFGNCFFKKKLFFILKFKLLNYFLVTKKSNILNKYTKFRVRNFIFFRFKQCISILKSWLLTFFINKYKIIINIEIKENLKFLKNDLKKLFLLYFYLTDNNIKNFILYSRKFLNWFSFKINRKSKTQSFLNFIAYNYKKMINLPLKFYKNIGFNQYIKFNNLKLFFLSLYSSIIYIYINIKLNNVFVIISKINGNTLFKYSAGFYGVSGRKKRDPESLHYISIKIAKKISKFTKLSIILKVKRKIKNKFSKKILEIFHKFNIFPICYYYLVNRQVSKIKIKKIRRL
jgi:hypothetical protein